jgi:hypothetical protein
VNPIGGSPLDAKWEACPLAYVVSVHQLRADLREELACVQERIECRSSCDQMVVVRLQALGGRVEARVDIPWNFCPMRPGPEAQTEVAADNASGFGHDRVEEMLPDIAHVSEPLDRSCSRVASCEARVEKSAVVAGRKLCTHHIVELLDECHSGPDRCRVLIRTCNQTQGLTLVFSDRNLDVTHRGPQGLNLVWIKSNDGRNRHCVTSTCAPPA